MKRLIKEVSAVVFGGGIALANMASIVQIDDMMGYQIVGCSIAAVATLVMCVVLCSEAE